MNDPHYWCRAVLHPVWRIERIPYWCKSHIVTPIQRLAKMSIITMIETETRNQKIQDSDVYLKENN